MKTHKCVYGIVWVGERDVHNYDIRYESHKELIRMKK